MSDIWSKIYIGPHVKYPLFLSDFDGTYISRQIFEKYSNIKFNENPLSGSQIVPHGWSDRRRTDGQTDLTMLIVAFRSFASAPKTDRLMSLWNWSRLFGSILKCICTLERCGFVKWWCRWWIIKYWAVSSPSALRRQIC
jgi:hypothetical protein